MFDAVSSGTLLKTAAALPDLFRSMTSDSLVEYTASTRVEPIVLVDTTVHHQPYMTDILQTLTNVFSGYYLQAIALSNTIGNISVLKRLDKFSPDRSIGNALVNATANSAGLASLESYQFKLPNFKRDSEQAYHVGMESTARATASVVARKPIGAPSAVNTVAKGAVAELKNIDNLAVGKNLEVTISANGQSIVIPVTVRMVPVAITPSVLVSTYAISGFKNKWIERWHRFRAGELSLIGDLILCNDIIDAHRKNMITDKSGVYAQTVAKRRKNKLAALISGQPSVATASNIAIISNQTAMELERELGGHLKTPAVRDKLFGENSLMLMVVVDPEWERITIWHRGIKLPTELSVRDIKSANKNTGPDIAEILKAYQMATAPSF